MNMGEKCSLCVNVQGLSANDFGWNVISKYLSAAVSGNNEDVRAGQSMTGKERG